MFLLLNFVIFSETSIDNLTHASNVFSKSNQPYSPSP